MIGDQRNYLYKLYAKFLQRYRPNYFVFENVVGLLSAKEKDGSLHFDNMRALFRECGYSTEYRVLNASDYGVLQNRKRVILIGKPGEAVGFYPEIPHVNTYDTTVYELLNDLPSINAGEGTLAPVETGDYSGTYLYTAAIKEHNHEPVTLHMARPHINQDLAIYKLVVEAWNRDHSRVSYTGCFPHRMKLRSMICLLCSPVRRMR